jgi:ketosteroid isomerase-like protein
MHKAAKDPNDLEKFFVERANAGDVDGLVALYEPSAIVAFGDGGVAIGQGQIRESFVTFLADRPHLDPSDQAPALCSGDLALTSSRLTNGDITAEVARRQPDGSWLWVVDQFALGNVSSHETRDRSPLEDQ